MSEGIKCCLARLDCDCTSGNGVVLEAHQGGYEELDSAFPRMCNWQDVTIYPGHEERFTEAEWRERVDVVPPDFDEMTSGECVAWLLARGYITHDSLGVHLQGSHNLRGQQFTAEWRPGLYDSALRTLAREVWEREQSS